MTSFLPQTDQSRLSLKYGAAVLRLWLDDEYADRNGKLNDLGHKFQAALLRYDTALEKADQQKAALKRYNAMTSAQQLKQDRPDFIHQVALADLAARKLFTIAEEILSDKYEDQPFNFTMVRKVLLEVQSAYDDAFPDDQSSAGARARLAPVQTYPGPQIIGSFLQSYLDEHGWKLTPQQFVMQQLEIEDFPNENPQEFYEDFWDSGIVGTKIEVEFNQWFKEQKQAEPAGKASLAKNKPKKKNKKQKAAEEVKKIRDEQRQREILEENKADIERLRAQLAATNLRQSETGSQVPVKELSPFGPVLKRIQSYKDDTRSRISITGAAASAESFQKKLLASLHVV